MSEENSLSRREFLERSLAAGAVVAGGGLLGGVSPSAARAATDAPLAKLKGKLAAQEFNLASIPNQQAFQALATIGRLLHIPTTKLSYDGNTNKELAQIDQMRTLGVTAVETLILDNGATRGIANACARDNIYLSTRAQVGLWVVPSEARINWRYQCLATPPDGAFVNCVNMFKAVGGRGNFVHLEGVAGSATDRAKTHAVDRALKLFPGIKLVARQRADYDREKARVTLDTILTRVNNDVKVVYCQNDDMALGALATLRNRGLARKVLVSGADAIPEVVDDIIQGNIFATEGIAPPFLAGYCMMQALDAANGHRPDPIEGLMQMDLIILDTPRSAQAYKATINQGPKAINYLKLSRILHPHDWNPQWPIRHFEPHQFWAVNQGVPKPKGYNLPSNYVRRVNQGGYREVDQMYLNHFGHFPFAEAVRSSRTKKTAFEIVYKISYKNF